MGVDLDQATIDHLQSGCAVLIGTVSDANIPRASRGTGITVVDAAASIFRVLIETDDPVTLSNLSANGRVAITTADVRTLQSMLFKGTLLGVEECTDADHAKAEQYRHDFLTDIKETDHIPMEVLLGWADRPFVPCIVQLHESFDQTPGPQAGAQLARRGAP